MGWIATLSDLDQCESAKTLIPVTAGRYLLDSVGCRSQVGHNDVCLKKSYSARYFFILNGSKNRRLYVCNVSHDVLFYAGAESWKTVEILKMHAIELFLFSIFVEQVYLQHAGVEH